jgi:hypothetical protein
MTRTSRPAASRVREYGQAADFAHHARPRLSFARQHAKCEQLTAAVEWLRTTHRSKRRRAHRLRSSWRRTDTLGRCARRALRRARASARSVRQHPAPDPTYLKLILQENASAVPMLASKRDARVHKHVGSVDCSGLHYSQQSSNEQDEYLQPKAASMLDIQRMDSHVGLATTRSARLRAARARSDVETHPDKPCSRITTGNSKRASPAAWSVSNGVQGR